MDADLRSLERAAAADPNDKQAALALATARVRAGAPVAVVGASYRTAENVRQTNGRVFVGSETGTPELTRKTRIKAARAVLEHLGIDPRAVTLSWDVHAGCSTCPCSPGYILKAKRPQDTVKGAAPPVARTRDGAPPLNANIFGTVVAVADGEPEPKSEMELIRDKLGIRNGGR